MRHARPKGRGRAAAGCQGPGCLSARPARPKGRGWAAAGVWRFRARPASPRGRGWAVAGCDRHATEQIVGRSRPGHAGPRRVGRGGTTPTQEGLPSPQRPPRTSGGYAALQSGGNRSDRQRVSPDRYHGEVHPGHGCAEQPGVRRRRVDNLAGFSPGLVRRRLPGVTAHAHKDFQRVRLFQARRI